MSDEEISCRQFVELVTDYFVDALVPDLLARMEEHLVMCDAPRSSRYAVPALMPSTEDALSRRLA